MRLSRPGVLALALTLAGAVPLVAQQTDSGMKQPMGHPMAAPGAIHGIGDKSATGTIHVVGKTMGSQKIHFTSDFKVDPSSNLHALLSGDMMAGAGAADLGAIASSGDQLIEVPRTVDVNAYATLLVYDTKYKMVVAATALPNAKGQAYSGMKDSTGQKSY